MWGKELILGLLSHRQRASCECWPLEAKAREIHRKVSLQPLVPTANQDAQTRPQRKLLCQRNANGQLLRRLEGKLKSPGSDSKRGPRPPGALDQPRAPPQALEREGPANSSGLWGRTWQNLFKAHPLDAHSPFIRRLGGGRGFIYVLHLTSVNLLPFLFPLESLQ